MRKKDCWQNSVTNFKTNSGASRQEELSLREENAARFTKVLDGRLFPPEIVYRNCQNSFSICTKSSPKYWATMITKNPTQCSGVNYNFWTNHRLENWSSRYSLHYISRKHPRKSRKKIGRFEKRFSEPEKRTRKQPRKVFGPEKFSGLLRNARQERWYAKITQDIITTDIFIEIPKFMYYLKEIPLLETFRCTKWFGTGKLSWLSLIWERLVIGRGLCIWDLGRLMRGWGMGWVLYLHGRGEASSR